jgi:glycosyltransferase involved in cell wall biosynthesis
VTRVLFVAHNAPRYEGDAPGSFVLRLAVALMARGVSVQLLVPHAAGLAEHDELEGVPIHRVRYAAEAAETLAYEGTMAQQVSASWAGKRALLGLLRAFRREVGRQARTVDVVHAHWWFPSGLAVAATARATGRPVVTTVHGSDVRLAGGAVGRRLFRYVAARSAQVTAVSSWLADETVRLTGTPRPVVAPMPIDTRRFTTGTGARDGLLFVGKLDRQKGLHVLLDALAMINQAVGSLTVVGAGPEAQSLRARAEALGVASRIRWLGPLPQPELPALYQRARVVVLPATAPEGLGLVAVEARACGAAIVASASGGLTDVAGDAPWARLVPPSDAGALAAAVNAVATTVVEPGAAMRAGFTPEEAATRYAALYADVLQRSAARA